MIEDNENLVPQRSSDLARIDNRLGIPPEKPLDINTAREILGSIVAIHESTITENTDFSREGLFSLNQAREAFILVGKNVVEEARRDRSGRTSGWDSDGNGGSVSASAESLDRRYSMRLDVGGWQDFVRLNLFDHRIHRSLIESMIPVATRKGATLYMAYYEHEKGVDISHPYDLTKGYTFSSPFLRIDLEKYRMLWRGMRWVAANLLDWGSIKLPGDLDQSSLEAPDTSSEVKEKPTGRVPKLNPRKLLLGIKSLVRRR